MTQSNLGIIITAFTSAAAMLLALGYLMPTLEDDEFLQFVVSVLLITPALVSLGNGVWFSSLQWRQYRINRASRRARALLLRLLSPEQRDQYLIGNPITVPIRHEENGKAVIIGHAQIGGDISGVRWRHGEFRLTGRGAPRWWRSGSQCVYVAGSDDTIGRQTLCPEDALIALLLWLRSDPERLRNAGQKRMDFNLVDDPD